MLGAGRLSLPSSPSQLRVDLGGAATTLFLALSVRLQPAADEGSRNGPLIMDGHGMPSGPSCALTWHVRAVLAAILLDVILAAVRSRCRIAFSGHENASALCGPSRRGGPPARERVR